MENPVPTNLKKIKLTEENGICTITIANPPVNALSKTVREEIGYVLDTAERDPDVNSIQITGEGNFFSAGADIKNELYPLVMSEDRKGKGYDFSQEGQRLMRRIKKFSKPVTAYIDGYAFGGGFELALACHKIIATQRSFLGLPEVTLGIIPGWGGTYNLFIRSLSASFASDMISRGTTISATEALCMNLIDEIDNEAHMNNKTLALPPIRTPAPMAQKTFQQLLLIKSLGNKYAGEIDMEELEARFFDSVFSEPDAREGITAFIEKREPKFKPIS